MLLSRYSSCNSGGSCVGIESLFPFGRAHSMARYKYIDTNPRFLAVDLARQLLPGTFEHALNHLLDHEIDVSHFDARFRNDETGATAYPPAMLLKVVLFAYSQGIVRSRAIERVCQELSLIHISEPTRRTPI